MVTGKETLVRLLPRAPVKVLRTGNLDYSVNFVGSDDRYLLLLMSLAIFTNTSFSANSSLFTGFSHGYSLLIGLDYN